MKINITKELKDELRRVCDERDILRGIAVDGIQAREKITREQAEIKVSEIIFKQLQEVQP